MGSLYTYESLSGENPVRFLSLLPSTPNGPIRCQIHHDDLSTAHEPYHAVSYTWGPPEPTEAIQIDNQTVSVRQNIFQFLKVMVAKHHRDGFQRLWIDALCINQSDIKEKNEQVSKMGRIYSSAQTVLIWLGPATEKINFAIDLFEKVRRETNDFQEGKSLTDATVYLDATPIEDEKEFEDSILDLFGREYWTRVWIMQEVFLTTRGKVMCGFRIVHLEDLEKYCSNMRMLNRASCKNIQTTPGFKICVRAARYKTDKRFGFILHGTDQRYDSTEYVWALLNWIRDQNCSEPRDKLFGILGIAADGRGFAVDYTESCVSVWIRALTHFPLLDSIHSADHLRGLLGLSIDDISDYLETEGGRKEKDIAIKVFIEPASRYSSSDSNEIVDEEEQDRRIHLLPNDIIIDFDGRNYVPKPVLLYSKDLSDHIYHFLALLYVSPTKDDKESPRGRYLTEIINHTLIPSLQFPTIHHDRESCNSTSSPSKPKNAKARSKTQVRISLGLLLNIIHLKTTFLNSAESDSLPPEMILRNPVQVAWVKQLGRVDDDHDCEEEESSRIKVPFGRNLRYRREGEVVPVGDEGRFMYWS